MNSKKELLRRLLDLHSVKTLKEFFPDQIGTSKDQIVKNVLSDISSADARSICLSNVSLTKQHAYLFDFRSQISGGPNWQFIDQEPALVLSNLDHVYTIRVKYPVFIATGNQVERTNVEFDWPVRIHLANRKLFVYITVLERDIRYIDSKIVSVGKRDIEEADIIHMISLKMQMILLPLDLNKGVKHLWENNIIDAKFVRFKNSHSVDTHAMDEDSTTRQKYPDKFDEIMHAPLNRTIFKVLDGVPELGSIFMVEPSNGKLAFRTFPFTNQQVYNVIERILRNN